MIRKALIAGACALSVLAGAGQALAQDVTLKTAFFISPGDSAFRLAFDAFFKEFNEKGKAKGIQLATAVGPEAIPGFQMPNALRNGIVDLIGVPPSYMSGLVPGIEGLSQATTPIAEQRKNGTYEIIRDIMRQRANAFLVAQYGDNAEFKLFMNKPITSVADLKGLRIRSTNTYKAFLDAAGAIPVNTGRGEVYTALERGVVDGYINLSTELKPLGWHKVTKFRVEPSFYWGTVILAMNNRTWERLSTDQKKFVEEMGLAMEGRITHSIGADEIQANKDVEAEGVKTIVLSPAEGQKLRKMAYDATWDAIVAKSPDVGGQMRKLLYAKQP